MLSILLKLNFWEKYSCTMLNMDDTIDIRSKVFVGLSEEQAAKSKNLNDYHLHLRFIVRNC